MSEKANSSPSDAVSSEPEPELFQIIDETGEGFGFDITPEALAKPLAIAAASLFSIGMLAGVPLGLAMGRVDNDAKRSGVKKARPTLDGLKFAASTFGLGTLLCGAMGVAGFYGITWHYEVDSFEEFGHIMRDRVPRGRGVMERGLGPALDVLKRNAGDNLPGPMKRMQERFHTSKFGKWMKEQIDSSITLDTEEGKRQESEPSHPHRSTP